MAQARLRITGVVQGVFYRDHARDMAISLDLTGYAKNMADGSVESLVFGEKEAIEKYANWCKEGSPSSSVENVEIEWMEETEKTDSFNTY